MIRDILREEIKKAVKKLYGKEVDFNIDSGGLHADYSSNVAILISAMSFLFKEHGNPRETAEKIKEEILRSENFNKYFFKVEIAGPAFLNFWLSEYGLEEGLKYAQNEKFDFGHEKIQVEFISANPTGPLTLGNGRGGVYGDVLSNIFNKAGYDVTKEYYINDAGNQVEIFMDTIREGKGSYIESIRKFFPKDVIESADELNIIGPVGASKICKDILDSIKKTVADMGISFDVWFSEQKELRDTGKVDQIIKWFEEKKLSYKTEDGALWFRAKKFGDDEDRVLIKKDGNPTYFCVDCAYHKDKFIERKFGRVINIWGADHHGNVARLKGFVKALGFEGKLEIILMQFVRLIENGKSVRMSKREGKFILIDDVLSAVGKDAFRYFMLMRSSDTHIDFDLDLAKERSKKNPVYYIQYAHARACSILRKSNLRRQVDFEFLIPKIFTLQKFCASTPRIQNPPDGFERKLILKLIQFSEIIEDIAKDYQVHRLTTYAYELAKNFTDFYENVRVLEAETDEFKKFRLALVFASRKILGKTLSLMGISAPEKM